MALVLADRVQQTGTANTTVSFTLSGSVTGYQSFAVVGNTNTTYYAATDNSGNWEVGIGTYSTTGPTLTRTTVVASSNSGSAVTFSGAVNVFVTYPAEKSVNLDGSGNVSALGTVSSGVWQGTAVAVGYGGTGATSAGIGAFNNITGYTASGATGTTSTNLVFSTSPTLTTPNIGAATATSMNIGTLTYTPANALISSQSSVSTYNQIILQNSNTGSTASADFIVNNSNSTDSTYYGDFGMNSSGFTGSGAFNQANYVYLTSTSTDLAIGTTTSNSIHFVIAGASTDAATINTSGAVAFNGSYGTAGQILQSNGSGSAPTWVNNSSPPEVYTPSNTTPASGATGVVDPVAMVGTGYYALYNFTQSGSQWQISTSSGFGSTVYDSGTVGAVTSFTKPYGGLSTSTVYYWRLRYLDQNSVWSSWSTPTSFTTASSFNYNLTYVAVGGGGGGNSAIGSNGGGAGGVFSSTTFSVAPGTVYTFTIGAGGNAAADGTATTIKQGATTLFTATQGYANGNSGNGFSPGSSGGHGGWGGGGGGGASANGTSGSGYTVGGNGGAGLASIIAGASSTYYGGGGGGGVYLAGGGGHTPGTGGTGGGGNANSGAGTANTGGGGAAGSNGGGGAGGSGVFVLQVPTSRYTATYTGTPTITTSGSYTILTFTSSGTYTA